MALMQIIEHMDESGQEMVRRIPEGGSGEFRLGSQLIVRESQWAVFFRDGKALDVFGPGRHTLSTQNIPLLTALVTTPLFGGTPFRAEVYFVSRRVFTDMKWGTAEPILFRDAEFKMIRLRANGIYSIQVTDPKLFVMKLVGTRAMYANSQIADFLRGIIVGRLADLLGEHLDSVLDLPRYFDELGAGLKARAKDDFYQYGLSLVDFLVNAISPPEEVQRRIDERSGMEAVGGMDRYFQYKAAQAIGDLARGGAGGGEAGTGEGAGGTAAAGLGLGAGAGLGFMIPGMIQQAIQGGAHPKVRCPNCHADVPFESRFCPSCGYNLSATVNCPQCQAPAPAGSKFCMNCGYQFGGAPPAAGAPGGREPAEPGPGPSQPPLPVQPGQPGGLTADRRPDEATDTPPSPSQETPDTPLRPSPREDEQEPGRG
jgi:membrane protease subunit (stomatin/prohibitin family)